MKLTDENENEDEDENKKKGRCKMVAMREDIFLNIHLPNQSTGLFIASGISFTPLSLDRVDGL